MHYEKLFAWLYGKTGIEDLAEAIEVGWMEEWLDENTARENKDNLKELKKLYLSSVDRRIRATPEALQGLYGDVAAMLRGEQVW